jgi:hypothetical protein
VIRDPEHAGKRHVWEPGDPESVCKMGFVDRGTNAEAAKPDSNRAPALQIRRNAASGLARGGHRFPDPRGVSGPDPRGFFPDSRCA